MPEMSAWLIYRMDWRYEFDRLRSVLQQIREMKIIDEWTFTESATKRGTFYPQLEEGE